VRKNPAFVADSGAAAAVAGYATINEARSVKVGKFCNCYRLPVRLPDYVKVRFIAGQAHAMDYHKETA
jgi:hypothetical protein